GEPSAFSLPPPNGSLQFTRSLFLPVLARPKVWYFTAGKQPCRGITRWAHRDDEVGVCELRSAPLPKPSSRPHRSDRPPCLENPRPEGAEHSLSGNGNSPFQAEPGHYEDQYSTWTKNYAKAIYHNSRSHNPLPFISVPCSSALGPIG